MGESGLEFSIPAVSTVEELLAGSPPAVAIMVLPGSELAAAIRLLRAAEGRSGLFAPIEATTVPSGNEKKSLEVWQHPISGRFASQQ